MDGNISNPEVMGVMDGGGYAVWTGGPRTGRRHSTV